MAIYRNKTILNQRGGSIDIDNTTDQEKIKISQRSGSNISLTNVVTSELATNNKQIEVINDSFETIKNDKSIMVGKNLTLRTGENNYTLKGFTTLDEIDYCQVWKSTYKPIALLNSQFKLKRGGIGYPNGASTPLDGERSDNPTLFQNMVAVENKFEGYTTEFPEVSKNIDNVTNYDNLVKRDTIPAKTIRPTKEDINTAAGAIGSNAPGVLKYGSEKNASTEAGTWSTNDPVDVTNLTKAIIDLQDLTLNSIEQNMGNGGDEIVLIKRDNYEQIGATFNDYPSIKIDPEGRSQPIEMVVSPHGTLKNHDFVPHVEIVDNASNFPGGDDDKVICNKMSRTVGSGGIHLKTTGIFEAGASLFSVGGQEIHLNATQGIQIASEVAIELQSVKSISLRTRRQVYVESALGIKNNLVVGGGIYAEGEVYLHHITAPLEVHETEHTTVYGKFNTEKDRELIIGEVNVFGTWFPVYAVANDNLIKDYAHSHHHHGIPMRLTQSNKDVRTIAGVEGINKHDTVTQSLPQIHERKIALSYTL